MRIPTTIQRSIVFLLLTVIVIAKEKVDQVSIERKFNKTLVNDVDIALKSDEASDYNKYYKRSKSCPCQYTKASKLICNLDNSSPSPPGQCDSSICSATELTLLNCHPNFTVISKEFILSLGICQSSLRTIRLRNCSIIDTTFGQGLEGLQVLDLRGNQVAAFRELEIITLESIYLSGNNWPCIDPSKEKRFRSKSSLQFGEDMSWLLEDYWTERWIDQNKTFCNLDGHLQTDDNETGQKHLVHSFLLFTRKTSSTCPELCDCEVADETIKFSLEDMSGYKVNVVCADLGLTSLPSHLPPDTIYLDMKNNQVSSLYLLSNMNPDYKNIERLILTNNSLQSLQGLENSWLQRNGPALLDVRDNFIQQLDTSALEPMLSKASINVESNYYFAGNPWSCNCQNIKTIQEFLEKYNSLIMDTEHMQCSECECSLFYLDYKEMCTQDFDYMIWVITAEVIVLLIFVFKLTWDCIRYRRTGHLPWVARHLCWSVPDITPGRWSWSSCLPSGCAQEPPASTSEGDREHNLVVSKGSSGYITISGNSSNSSKNCQTRICPGGKEDSVVRFV